MRSRIVTGSLVVFAALTIGIASRSAADPAVKWAAVNLTDSVLIGGTFVSGPVVFVHDDARMAQGQPCTSVHRYEADKGVGKELVAFHCKPRWGKAPSQFTKAVNITPDGLRIMTEYQFAGDEEAHGIPTVMR